MTTEGKMFIGVCLIALIMVGIAIVEAIQATERTIDYEISKSCKANQAFQIKGTHYYCVEIEERKK
jgi:hypothetical protein